MFLASSAHRRTSRRAFTLVELLVVISIIAVLIGLLLPAVNSARESGRRTKCTNNQYQMAMAVIRHNDSNGYVPGWRNALTCTGTTIYPSWSVAILPFVEQNDVYKAVALSPVTLPSTAIELFACPSTLRETNNVPALSYSGNCGSASNAFRFDGVMLDTTITTRIASGRLGMDDISNADGTTRTLLLSEKSSKAATPAFWNSPIWRKAPNASFPVPGAFDFGDKSIPPCFGIYGPKPPTLIINCPTPIPPGADSQPSSQHPGGAVVAFCDGHTSFLQEGISSAVYAQVLSWNHLEASPLSRTAWGAETKFPLSDSDLE